MALKALRVLIVEDTDDDRALMEREIRRHGYTLTVRCVMTGEAFAEALAGDWDVILSDYSLPSFSGAAALALAQASGRDIPFIVITGTVSEEAAVEMMKAGAQDFITKGRIARLVPAIEREVAEAQRRARLAAIEAQRQRTLTQWLSTLESMSEGFCAVEPDWTLAYFNRAAEELLGRQREDVLGKPWADLGLPGDLERAMSERVSVTFEAPLGGGERWFEVRAYPSRVTGGLAIFLRDVTAPRLLLDHERRARADAEAASRMKDEFLATLSHELRTPLTTTLGWAEVLQKGRLTGETKARAYEAIERAARRQVEVVNDIIDMSRLMSGQMTLRARTVDLPRVIEAALVGLRTAALAKNIQLESALDRGAGPVVGDSQRLRQAVWNLVGNAVKFTPKGGSVRVALTREEGAAILRIEDTGMGIDARFLPALFQPFRQADPGRTRAHGGLGLGLALTRQVIELHGGHVAAESEGPGRGACFTVTLPIRGGAPAEEPAPEPLRVVYVGPDDADRELVRAVLETTGSEVVAVEGPHAAAALVGADVLIVGASEPDAIVRAVRALAADRGGAVPAIAITDGGDARDRIAAGFQLRLARPLEPDRILAAVARAADWRAAGPGATL